MATYRSISHASFRSPAVLCLVACLVSAVWPGNPALAGENDEVAESGYSYYYFKARLPLKLDTARVAVWLASEEKDAEEAKPDPSRYGPAVSAAAPMAVRGWWFLETDEWVRTDTAIERAVSQIAGEEHAEFVSPVFLDDEGEPVVITPHILVGFDRRLDRSRVEAILAKSGAGTIVDRDWANMKRAYRLESAARNGFEVLAAANELARLPEVTFAEPDMMVTGHLAWIPDDPYFPYLWALHNDGTFPGSSCTLFDFDMDAPEAWDVTIGDPSVIVAVLDSGIQLDHPDLNLYASGFDATGEGGGGGPVNACDVHGTWVAGAVSGVINNQLGIVGVAPGVKTASARMIVSSLACDLSGTIAASWVVDALAWAESIGARITNSSWYRNSPDAAIDQKYADTRAKMLHFAAAGNDGMEMIRYPASLSSVDAVAALSPCGHRADFSNWGAGLAFSAPGHYLISTDRTGRDGGNDGIDDGACVPDGMLGCSSDADCSPGQSCLLVSLDDALVAGTSFASPYSAGVAALALSVKPHLTADDVEVVLEQTAVDPVDLDPVGYDTDFGWGFVNAANAVQLALTITPGEAADLRVTGFDPTTGNLDLSYQRSCAARSHDIYYGPLSQVATYGWSGSTCGIGNTGQYSGFNPGPQSYFFVLVGDDEAIEGSYGENSLAVQRPAAGASYCGRTQQLATACPLLAQ